MLGHSRGKPPDIIQLVLCINRPAEITKLLHRVRFCSTVQESNSGQVLRQICFQAAAARFVSVAGCSWPVVVQTSGRRRTACRNSGTGISGVAILARYVRCVDSVGSRRRPAVLPTRPVPARGNSLSPAPLPWPPPPRRAARFKVSPPAHTLLPQSCAIPLSCYQLQWHILSM